MTPEEATQRLRFNEALEEKLTLAEATIVSLKEKLSESIMKHVATEISYNDALDEITHLNDKLVAVEKIAREK